MVKTLAKKVTPFAAILGFVLVALLPNPQTARAQSTHEGKFNVGANGRVRIFNNATLGTKTILVTICVSTSGPQSAIVDVRDGAGSVVTTLPNVRLGQCRSATAELATDEAIAVAASVSIAGTYNVSVLP